MIDPSPPPDDHEPSSVAHRADQLFREHRDANFQRTSRLFAVLMVLQWVFAVGYALVFSPYGWEGKVRNVHAHVWIALFLGAGLSSLPLYLTMTRPTEATTRHVVAVGQMLWSAMLIHLSGGRIETHFHVFGSLAFLAFYRDWKVLLTATVVIATDHLARQMFWPESVFGMINPEWWRFLEHALWVVFEDTVLIASCLIVTEEMRGVARSRAEVELLSEREARKSEQLQGALDELARSQGSLVRAEKLAAVGQLAASVGHELRNPLAAVRNANTYIGKKLKGAAVDARVLQFNGLIEKELDTCGKIIGDLLDFARERPLVLAPTPLRELIEEAIALIPPHQIEIVNTVPAALPMPLLDKEQFRQILINLTQNAVEAMEPRGSGKVTIGCDQPGPHRFRLTIDDDGPGIPAEVVDQMFEPLFTTKVKGTGLGLAIVAGIIKRHGGTIAVDSKPGRGTQFVIDWTVNDARGEPRPSTAPSRPAAGPVAAVEASSK